MKTILCYAREDSYLMEAVANWLSRKTIAVELCPLAAASFLMEHRLFDPSTRLVVGLSPLSVLSPWVRQGVSSSIVLGHVLPVLLRPCEVPLLLRDMIYANFVTNDFETACQDLYKALFQQDGKRPQPNRILRSWDVTPVGTGEYAKIVEFGVLMRCVYGLHIEVDAGTPYILTKDWYGLPNAPYVPLRPGGPFFHSSLKQQPPIYSRTFREPTISPNQSYYLYIEANEPLQLRERVFTDAQGRIIQ
jgi:hypothetical protein